MKDGQFRVLVDSIDRLTASVKAVDATLESIEDAIRFPPGDGDDGLVELNDRDLAKLDKAVLIDIARARTFEKAIGILKEQGYKIVKDR